MTTPTTRQKQARRLAHKGLEHQLLHAFLHSYGYRDGPLPAQRIVQDIMAKVEAYYGPDRDQALNQIVYTAADAQDRPTRGKTVAQTLQRAILLTMISPEDCQAYALGAPTLARRRILRWLQEAHAQGALLTTADLALLAGISTGTVERHIRQHEAETGVTLPLRGTVHDSSSKLTHKADIVEQQIQGKLPPEIARDTGHSLEAVERYLQDFALIRQLASDYDADGISALIGRGRHLVQQYLDIIDHHRPLDDQTNRHPPPQPDPSGDGSCPDVQSQGSREDTAMLASNRSAREC